MPSGLASTSRGEGAGRQGQVLENAFRTPAKIDLNYGFDLGLMPPLPPLPELPGKCTGTSQERDSPEAQSVILDTKDPTLLHLNMTTVHDSPEAEEDQAQSKLQLYSQSQAMAIKGPTLFPGSDSLASIAGIYEVSSDNDDSMSVSDSFGASSSSSYTPSAGQLNRAFKFGGLPKSKEPHPPVTNGQNKPQTLSDIIPPPSHVRTLSDSSMMDEDDSVLKSIFAKASDIPAPQSRRRVNSDSSAKRRTGYRHSRHSSGLSFVGFDSFDEFRRGFEFGSDRAPFYPPPASRRNNYGRPDSLLSIASVSSYGRVINYGSNDPFDYGLPSLRERPSSEDMTMMTSTSVDDTFSFMHNRPRRRVESDASSFYFKAPTQSSSRRQESNMSVASHAPPISRFNRNAHRRSDSNTSISSVAQSYPTLGTASRRSTWAKYRPDSYIDSLSMDSVSSDFSAMRLGRPGVGDKMFDTAMDHGAPLPAISASPSESVVETRFENRSSFDYDSIIDDDERMSSMEDDSVFGNNERAQASLLPPDDHFRPLSVLSFNNSTHSPMKDGDTMISVSWASSLFINL
jgi:serine/arginine repetitive matrix protein 2